MHKIVKIGLSVSAAFVMNMSLAFGMEEDDRRPVEHLCIKPAIPDVALGHEDIYKRFLKGVLVYRPTEGSDVGKIELPIASLINPLESTFDLSSCDDAGKYLSIATGYRKGQISSNANKIEVWLAPRFLIEKDLQGAAKYFAPIMSTWDAKTATIGVFFTWGGWDYLGWYDYLTSKTPDHLSSENLYKNLTEAQSEPTCTHNAVMYKEKSFYAKNFMFILN